MAVASKKIPAPDHVKVRTALLSVSDKTGVADFAKGLAALGVEILSTGAYTTTYSSVAFNGFAPLKAVCI